MAAEVKQGRLEGVIRKSILTGKEYYGFLGIPYAKPPVGDLRFQPPEPIEKWNGTFQAKNHGPPCIQLESEAYIGSEDCLYLNVYTPCPIKKGDAKAVMFFIHGGSFLDGSGSSDIYSPDYLINQDVILVTVNYRLHVLGFLNMGTKNNAGNCGLRDQCLALKWVNENIKQFGGDPKNITIFGESSGAAAVYFHLLSPMSKGLFNKAILQSDIMYSDFRYATYAQNLGYAVAKQLGWTGKDPEKLVEFLKKQTAVDLCKGGNEMLRKYAQNGTPISGDISEIFFLPWPEIGKKNAFLPDTILNLQKKATPVPLLAGFNNQDGKTMLSRPNILEELKKDFTKVINHLSKFDSMQFKNVCDKIREVYLGDKPVGAETAEKIVDIKTDYHFRHFHDSYDFITNSKTNTPVYVYEFAFYGKFNVFEPILLPNGFALGTGACHADELPYLFYPKILLPNLKEFGEPELTVIKNMCILWTNFAKYGNPTEGSTDFKWKPTSCEKPCFVRITKELKFVEEKLRGKEFEFMKKLID